MVVHIVEPVAVAVDQGIILIAQVVVLAAQSVVQVVMRHLVLILLVGIIQY